MTSPEAGPRADAGSFRDSVNRVFSHQGRIVRGLSVHAAEIYQQLADAPFYRKLQEQGLVVSTVPLDTADPLARQVLREGWHQVLEHAAVPFISYPYEWSFSMLKDAALTQLRITEEAHENGWTLKDATPYNIQFVGSRPVFIDIGSFEPWHEGDPWIGYRQFTSMFLVPLMLKTHLGIDPRPLLRSQLEGIPPLEAARYFRGAARLKRGVLTHVTFPAMVEAGIAKRERDAVPAQRRGAGRHSKAMVVGLIQGLSSLIRSLKSDVRHTDWSHYSKTHSYDDADFAAKAGFVQKHLGPRRQRCVWDVGCNTGHFSRLAAEHSDYVVSIDADADSIEQLYLAEKAATGNRILPLVANMANISPDQGWGGRERRALDNRGRPDAVLCLALIHHMRVSANVPIPMFLAWLRSLNAQVIIEFVDRQDEMFVKLLANKTIDYADYTLDAFVAEAEALFQIKDREKLKDGRREIFLLSPR